MDFDKAGRAVHFCSLLRLARESTGSLVSAKKRTTPSRRVIGSQSDTWEKGRNPPNWRRVARQTGRNPTRQHIPVQIASHQATFASGARNRSFWCHLPSRQETKTSPSASSLRAEARRAKQMQNAGIRAFRILWTEQRSRRSGCRLEHAPSPAPPPAPVQLQI